MRRIRTVAVLPTMFTLANLVCGFFAIVVASRIGAPVTAERPTSKTEIHIGSPVGMVSQLDHEDPTHNAMLAGWLIFLAMIFDALDGHVARLSKTSSDFGAQLDSLCDMITFGVAPAILLVKICPTYSFLHREGLWVIATTFAACAAMRLARFNVESGGDEDDHMYFCGLPSPAAAAAIAGFAIMFYTLRRESNALPYAESIDLWMQSILPFFALLLGLLMVSRVPYPHVVNQLFRGHRSFNHVVGLVFALVIIMLMRGYAVPVVCCIFVLGPLLRFGLVSIRQTQAARKSI